MVEFGEENWLLDGELGEPDYENAVLLRGDPDLLERHLASRPDLIERIETGLDQLARGEGTERAW